MMDLFKKIPLPIWIGLGLVLILIVVMGNRSSSQSQPSSTVAGGNVTSAAGPVTNATVGTQGAQNSPGTDQELGNLSVMTQSGFAQIATQEQQNSALLSQLTTGNGSGTPMQQFGTNVQAAQTTSAASNATNGTVGQNAGSNPSSVATTG